MQMKNIITVIGTRPEAIKLLPVIEELNNSTKLKNELCITRQHSSLIDSLFNNASIKIDYQFQPCKKNASLAEMAAHLLLQFNNLLIAKKPDLLIVQGDTSTAFIAALAGFYAKVKIAHIEAGLRSGDLTSPWPEEAHRIMIDKISDYFFVPTEKAKNHLIKENVESDKIWIVGNTSIDSIRILEENSQSDNDLSKNIIVVTIHRRENHGQALINICHALKLIALEFPNITIKICMHPNPSVSKVIKENLSQIKNIKLSPAINHKEFIKLLDQSMFIITDSGGIQEEATFLGKAVLIIRTTTERDELTDNGTGILVGTKTENIVKYCRLLLKDQELLSEMSKKYFPYGDGQASKRIVKILEQIL